MVSDFLFGDQKVMKPILCVILFVFAISLDVGLSPTITTPCFGELTENDIRRIIREEIEPLKIEMAEIKGKMATKDDIIATNQKLNDKVDSLNQQLSDKIDTLYGIIIASFVTLIVVIAVPQILIAYRERRESRLSKEVDELKQRITELERKKILA
jgi:hypothetical protein